MQTHKNGTPPSYPQLFHKVTWAADLCVPVTHRSIHRIAWAVQSPCSKFCFLPWPMAKNIKYAKGHLNLSSSFLPQEFKNNSGSDPEKAKEKIGDLEEFWTSPGT